MILFIKICLVIVAICFIYPIIHTLVNISYKDEGKFTLQDELDYEEAQEFYEELQIKEKIEEERKLK